MPPTRPWPIAMEESNSDIKSFVVDHPRMMGVLFALALLLSQIGTVAAASGSTTIGP